MFLVKKIDFDNSEKHYSSARSYEDLGLIRYKQDFDLLSFKSGTYKGWDGEMYPQFQLIALPMLAP